MVKIAPSILAADFSKLGEEIRSVADADYIHFDVMDGVFVHNISFGLPVLESVRDITSKTLDVHLMINAPSRFIKEFIKAGGDIITIHIEAEEAHITRDSIKMIHALGKKAGLSLRPATPVTRVLPYIEDIDLVLVMSVEPGYGGQEFMSEALPKIRDLRDVVDRSGSKCEIEVDGGVNLETAKLCIEAGADVLVTGNDVFSSVDRAGHIKELRGT